MPTKHIKDFKHSYDYISYLDEDARSLTRLDCIADPDTPHRSQLVLRFPGSENDDRIVGYVDMTQLVSYHQDLVSQDIEAVFLRDTADGSRLAFFDLCLSAWNPHRDDAPATQMDPVELMSAVVSPTGLHATIRIYGFFPKKTT